MTPILHSTTDTRWQFTMVVSLERARPQASLVRLVGLAGSRRVRSPGHLSGGIFRGFQERPRGLDVLGRSGPRRRGRGIVVGVYRLAAHAQRSTGTRLKYPITAISGSRLQRAADQPSGSRTLTGQRSHTVTMRSPSASLRRLSHRPPTGQAITVRSGDRLSVQTSLILRAGSSCCSGPIIRF